MSAAPKCIIVAAVVEKIIHINFYHVIALLPAVFWLCFHYMAKHDIVSNAF
jgi:hypothetical protein